MKTQAAKPTVLFSAQLPAPKANGCAITIPKKETAKLPPGKSVVEGTINLFPFRGQVEVNGKDYVLKISKAVYAVAAPKIDEPIQIEITRVGEEPEIRIPEDFGNALATNANAKQTWTIITPMARREWVLFISTCKQAETRQKRIDKAVDMLSKGKRRVCCFPGLNWMTKDHPGAETWLPLPDAKNQS